MHAPTTVPSQWIPRLREFARGVNTVEHCELCGLTIASQHAHLVERANRRLLCSCPACALLFSSRTDGRYCRVPGSGRRLDDFKLNDAEWDELRIPVNLAFFFHATDAGRIVALYPGPAGATESRLSLAAWHTLERANPMLEQLHPDVEALLVNRIDEAREYWRMPIDRCYALVGLIRRRWRGVSGGRDVSATIREFLSTGCD